MKRILLASVAAAACMAGPAVAADLAVRAPAYKAPPPIVPVYSWTGFYVGGNVGGAWARDDVTWVSNKALFGIAFGTVLDAAGTGRITSSGVTAGGQVGFNYQVNNVLVWGAEADLNYTGLSANRNVPVPPPGVPGTFVNSTF